MTISPIRVTYILIKNRDIFQHIYLITVQHVGVYIVLFPWTSIWQDVQWDFWKVHDILCIKYFQKII